MECYCLQRAVWRNGGSSPQTILCGNERLYPAGSIVEAATTPSRWDVMRQRAERQWEREKRERNLIFNNILNNLAIQ